MTSKIYLLNLLIILISQQRTNAVSQTNEKVNNLSFIDIVNNVKQIFEYSQKEADEIIGVNIGNLKVSFNKLIQFKDKYLQDCISKTFIDILKYIKETRDDRFGIGVNIIKCLDKQNTNIENFTNNLFNNLDTCVSKVVNKSYKIDHEVKEIKKILFELIKLSVRNKCLIMFKNVLSPIKFANYVSNELSSLSIDRTKTLADFVANRLSSHTLNEITNKSLMSDTSDVTAEINATINGNVVKVIRTLHEASQRVQNVTSKELDIDLSTIVGFFGDVYDYSKKYIKFYAGLGIDIYSCVENPLKEIDNRGTVYISNIVDCVTVTREGILSFINNGLQIINNTASNIKETPVNVTNCLKSVRPITCMAELLEKLLKIKTALPVQMENLVDKVSALIENLPVNLEKCVGKLIASADEEKKIMINQIEMCIDKLILSVQPQQKKQKYQK